MSSAEVWAELKEKLPYERTDEEKKKRMEQWSKIDVNGNGYLSLAEIDKGMRDVVDLPTLFDIKPVLMRAFQAAKSASPAKSDKDNDYIQKNEYRLLLQYLRQYYEYWLAFERVDTDGDRRVSYDEFEKAKDTMAKWGIDLSDPKAQWKECDKDGGGMVLFAEFCDWAIKKNLDLEDDDE
ncbi:EFh [Seminavis robusta]|uniref:EFh n=1 Tax=Seminavis robusta TaxID=568900 RepID=A0A9N8HHR6_9STRA|nr:EFh [Seminavis robusta]|eukprot:Sro654_g182060.1 EFh (180) ;mRNA; r:22176-22715